MTIEWANFVNREAEHKEKKLLKDFLNQILNKSIYEKALSYNPETSTIQLVDTHERVAFPFDAVYSIEVRNNNFLSVYDKKWDLLLWVSRAEFEELSKQYYKQERNHENSAYWEHGNCEKFSSLLKNLAPQPNTLDSLKWKILDAISYVISKV